MASNNAQLNNSSPINPLLIWLSALANGTAVISFVILLVQQDLLLVTLMLVTAVVAIAIAYLVSQRPFPTTRVLMVFVGSLVFAIVAVFSLANSEVTPLNIRITDPQDSGIVTRPEQGYLVNGTVSDSNARVHIIVRTIPAPNMWVQQPAIVGRDGKWQATVYFGDEGINNDESYEVIALATNDNFLVTWLTGNRLRQGQELLSLPRRSNKSSLVTVTRLK